MHKTKDTDTSSHIRGKHFSECSLRQVSEDSKTTPRSLLDTSRKRKSSLYDLADSKFDYKNEIRVCICPPDPKIPRPRNAFILYRQHHQGNLVSKEPNLSNPEISKIIGQQWQAQPPEIKRKWKTLAEEEKLRHQRKFPTYRFQPKRSGRRITGSSEVTSPTSEHPYCPKCGGSRSNGYLQYTTSSKLQDSPATSPPTPAKIESVITHSSRTTPALDQPSFKSPAASRLFAKTMSVTSRAHSDDREDMGPGSPNTKRRRYNGEPVPTLTRMLPTRYPPTPPGVPVAIGTPVTYGPSPTYSYPPAAAFSRRDSVPNFRGMVSPTGHMAPPPRPVIGYQQHRLSQGHGPHDRSLTLPPLKTDTLRVEPGASSAAITNQTAEEQIMSLDFRQKVQILGRIAPPSPVTKSAVRGPLVAIEGDNPDAVKELGHWLADTLRKTGDFSVQMVRSPKVHAEGSKEMMMAQYHRLVAEWLSKSSEIMQSLAIEPASRAASVVEDVHSPASRKGTPTETNTSSKKSHSPSDSKPELHGGWRSGDRTEHAVTESEGRDADDSSSSAPSVSRQSSIVAVNSTVAKPLAVITNYSLYASNYFACHIPIKTTDPYAPADHWQWTATQWRGVISPDLTVYVRDAVASDTGKPTVEIIEEGNQFIVKRTKVPGNDSWEMEPSVLRRLGFEVSEWVRAFGSKSRGSSKEEGLE